MISRLRFRSGVNLAFLQLITTTVTAGSAAPRGESVACNSSHTDTAFPTSLESESRARRFHLRRPRHVLWCHRCVLMEEADRVRQVFACHARQEIMIEVRTPIL